jgi:hypothetical protein
LSKQKELIEQVNVALKNGMNTSFKREGDYIDFVLGTIKFYIGKDYSVFGYNQKVVCSVDKELIKILKEGIEVAITNESNKNSECAMSKMIGVMSAKHILKKNA